MPELKKRINSGWVLMDSMTVGQNQVFFLERGLKAKCTIEIEPDGHGWLSTSTGVKRI